MYVFGGWDGAVTLSDINVFDMEKKEWYFLNGVKGAVKGRYRHTAITTE